MTNRIGWNRLKLRAPRRNRPFVEFRDDAHLVNRLIAGNERAFADFFHDNFDRIYRFALIRLSNDQTAAENVVQESLSVALNRIKEYRGATPLFAWLCSICVDRIAEWSQVNSAAPEPAVLIEDSPEFEALVDTYKKAPFDESFEIVHCSNTRHLIQVALDQLPVTYAKILQWRYIERQSTENIGQELGIDARDADSRVARAKDAFTKIYIPLARAAQSMRVDSRNVNVRVKSIADSQH